MPTVELPGVVHGHYRGNGTHNGLHGQLSHSARRIHDRRDLVPSVVYTSPRGRVRVQLGARWIRYVIRVARGQVLRLQVIVVPERLGLRCLRLGLPEIIAIQ